MALVPPSNEGEMTTDLGSDERVAIISISSEATRGTSEGRIRIEDAPLSRPHSTIWLTASFSPPPFWEIPRTPNSSASLKTSESGLINTASETVIEPFTAFRTSLNMETVSRLLSEG